ncbi:hypothetical protein Patl1_30451 [Pistacia atlantica]|uniref:Uncharacterized protein n=1 Tax=Pistacia atlantica TaxID=434234 RepID=A0ACC1A883_9ROSI|nr:hypothetical protein Patl1_30451 [Pistacia atlantica]
MPVLGGDKEFASSSLFSTNCVAARFVSGYGLSNSSQTYFEYTKLNCNSGIDGGGVVCKR